MNDSSEALIPFTFSDLAADVDERSHSGFVSLFSRPKKEAAPEKPEDDEEGAAEPSASGPAPPPPPTPEDLARKAFEDAYVQGEKAGYEMGMRRVDALAKRLEKHMGDLMSFRKDLEERYGKLTLDLALEFAEAIVLRECGEKREVLGAMVRKALEACEDKDEIVVRVRTEDFKYVKDAAPPRLRVVADDTLDEPGFVIETQLGDIDGRVSSQIEELKNAVLGRHAE